MGYLYTAFVIGVAVLIANLTDVWWERFKAWQAQKPVTLKQNRNGVHVPRAGIVQILQRAGYVYLTIWVIWLVAMTSYGCYYKFILHREPELWSLLTAGIL